MWRFQSTAAPGAFAKKLSDGQCGHADRVLPDDTHPLEASATRNVTANAPTAKLAVACAMMPRTIAAPNWCWSS